LALEDYSDISGLNFSSNEKSTDSNQTRALKKLINDDQVRAAISDQPYKNMRDETVVTLAHDYDVNALEYILNKYRNFVRAKARSYFLIGADHDDIIQEGMIGLYKAVRDFKPDKQNSFRAFAELCITRQIITAIKSATRQKHLPLNSYVSLNRPVYDEESERTMIDVISENKGLNPEEIIIDREELNIIEQKISKILSKLELKVLNAYVDGKSYTEIALELGRDVKSIDNALQRIKAKMEKNSIL
jgi:RNA polymerase sporulation-specific sigma factor